LPKPKISWKKLGELASDIADHPEMVCYDAVPSLAKLFARGKRARTPVETADPPSSAAPAHKKQKQNKTNSQLKFKCTAKHVNGKVCTSYFYSKRGLSNHHRTCTAHLHEQEKKRALAVELEESSTKSEEAEEFEEESNDDDLDDQVSILKLTVASDVYDVMTALPGQRGKKRKECRPDKIWVRQRLDGRHYDYVKMYPGIPYFDDDARWTMWECEGYERVGEDGKEYEVQDYGGENEGFVLVVDGYVWEIYLGKVVARNRHDDDDQFEGPELEPEISSAPTTGKQQEQSHANQPEKNNLPTDKNGSSVITLTTNTTTTNNPTTDFISHFTLVHKLCEDAAAARAKELSLFAATILNAVQPAARAPIPTNEPK
jgi:hypothetical protein